jgi:H+-translocating NAD(P) transhydrogenase subunit beta
MSAAAFDTIIHFSFLVSAACFVLALKWMSSVSTARRGVIFGVVGMLLAVGGTLASPEIEHFIWIGVAVALGTTIGIPLAMIPMTAVPQRTAFSHAFGALAVTLIGAAEFYLHSPQIDRFTMVALSLEVLLGSITCTASLVAAGKLQEILPTRPMVFKFQRIVNLTVFALAFGLAILMVVDPGAAAFFPVLIACGALFGALFIMPIGGADMPTVISLLNSYAGLSAAMMGFVLNNKLLIIAGALDGSSGLILSIIMCKAMNRSFANVLFGAFGQVQASAASAEKTYKSAGAQEAAELLRSASAVMVVPGYGMAVAQAQHKVRELFDILTGMGVDVRFAIHPVAGRMPGHMNVLLAEADVPYDKLVEMDDANPDFPRTDVTLIIGANDVTNPAARNDASSPIYGMPILDVDKSRLTMVIKRSMSPGYAGIDNELYYNENNLMLFGDAKAFVSDIVKALSGEE